MTRKDIARTIADQLGLTQIQASQIVHKLFDAIVNTLVEEGRVELRNFGVFEGTVAESPQGPQPAYW